MKIELDLQTDTEISESVAAPEGYILAGVPLSDGRIDWHVCKVDERGDLVNEYDDDIGWAFSDAALWAPVSALTDAARKAGESC